MGQRILVIDDEPAIYKLVKTLLDKAGYEATAVSNAEEGLKFLATGTLPALPEEEVVGRPIPKESTLVLDSLPG